MRIALTTSLYPPEIGGPSAQTRDFAIALTERGVATSVLVCGTQTTVSETPGLEVRHIVPPLGGGKWKKVSRQVHLFQSIVGFLRETRPDVVHQQVFGSNFCVMVGMACRMLRIPSVLKVTAERHTEVLNSPRMSRLAKERPHEYRLRAMLLKGRDALCLKLFDRVWVTTPTFQRRLAAGFRLSPGRMVLYPNFISLDRFRSVEPEARREALSDNAPLRLLTVCRLQPWKGVDDCLTAAAQLPGKFRWRFVGAGEPAYEAELKQKAQSLGLAEKVEFLGAIPPDSVRAEFTNADLFILGSRYEPFGIVLLEAMSMGVPIVATTAGGIPDVLEHEKTGLLVPPGRPELLGASIVQLMGDARRRKELIAAGRQRALDFGMDRAVEFFLPLYSGMSKRSSAPSR